MCVILLKVSFIVRFSFFYVSSLLSLLCMCVCAFEQRGCAAFILFSYSSDAQCTRKVCGWLCMLCAWAFFSLHVNERSSAATLYLFMQRNYVSDEQVPMMRLLIKMYNFITCGRMYCFLFFHGVNSLREVFG